MERDLFRAAMALPPPYEPFPVKFSQDDFVRHHLADAGMARGICFGATLVWMRDQLTNPPLRWTEANALDNFWRAASAHRASKEMPMQQELLGGSFARLYFERLRTVTVSTRLGPFREQLPAKIRRMERLMYAGGQRSSGLIMAFEIRVRSAQGHRLAWHAIGAAWDQDATCRFVDVNFGQKQWPRFGSAASSTISQQIDRFLSVEYYQVLQVFFVELT